MFSSLGVDSGFVWAIEKWLSQYMPEELALPFAFGMMVALIVLLLTAVYILLGDRPYR